MAFATHTRVLSSAHTDSLGGRGARRCRGTSLGHDYGGTWLAADNAYSPGEYVICDVRIGAAQWVGLRLRLGGSADTLARLVRC